MDNRNSVCDPDSIIRKTAAASRCIAEPPRKKRRDIIDSMRKKELIVDQYGEEYVRFNFSLIPIEYLSVYELENILRGMRS